MRKGSRRLRAAAHSRRKFLPALIKRQEHEMLFGVCPFEGAQAQTRATDLAHVFRHRHSKNSELCSLGHASRIMCNDARLKSTAERAAWLGNDETHYVRKWEYKDLQDLKEFIVLTEYWVESEHLTKESVAQMPEGKK